MRILYLCSIVYMYPAKKGRWKLFRIGNEKRYCDHWVSSLALTNRLYTALPGSSITMQRSACFAPDGWLKKYCFILRFSLDISNLTLWTSLSTIQILKTSRPVNDQKYVFHFRPKPNIWPEKHLALGRIPKPKPNVQIFVKIGGILL